MSSSWWRLIADAWHRLAMITLVGGGFAVSTGATVAAYGCSLLLLLIAVALLLTETVRR